MAISDHLVPLAADDALLFRLREFARGEDRPDDAFWDEYNDAVNEARRSIDMWRLGIEINDALSVDLAIERRELVWTNGAETIRIGEDLDATYLPPAELRALMASLGHLTTEELDRRIVNGAGPNVPREEVVERAAEVLDMMRWAVANGVGLLRDFSP